MKKLLVFILFYSTGLFAQQHKIDSLVNLLKSDKEDTNKVNHLNNLTNEYNLIGDSYHDSLSWQNAMNLAQKLNFSKGIAGVYMNMGLFYFNKADYTYSISLFEKTLKIYTETGKKNSSSAALDDIGINYYAQGNFEKAIEYYYKALNIAKEVKNGVEEGNTLGNIASVYEDEGNYPISLEFQVKALNLKVE